MQDRPSSRTEQVDVHPAPAQLRAWCLCAVVRRVHAGPVQARIQASTWASINAIVEGEVHGADGVLPRRFLTTPFAVPFETRTPGPLRSISLVLQPWALEPLAGRAAGALGPRPQDVALFTPSPLDALCEAMHDVGESGDLAALWEALHAQASRMQGGPPALAWETLAANGVEAAASALACSPRQYLRRFRRAMGLPPASWLRMRRWETALQALAAGEEASMAQLSLRHGFADQAHLARDARALVEESPARLRKLLQDGEGPWSLRPAHVRLIQDRDETRA